MLIRTVLLLALVLPVFAGEAPALLDLRVGAHERYDRVVFEFASAAQSHMTVKAQGRIEVRFMDIAAPEDFGIPLLPAGLSVIRKIEARREGKNLVVYQIELLKDATPTDFVLDGTPWRLAVDLAPRVNETPQTKRGDEKPDYVPGDLPIPTRLAEAQPAGDTLNPARLHEQLAYYYLAHGDTQRARTEASLYQQAAGHALTGMPLGRTTPPAPPAQHPTTLQQPSLNLRDLGLMLGLAAALGLGLFGGVKLRAWLRTRKSAPAETPDETPPPEAPVNHDELATELELDMSALDQAVKQEPPRTLRPPIVEPEITIEVTSEAQPCSEEEQRIRALLREGHGLSAIAKHMQMQPDEVLRILKRK